MKIAWYDTSPHGVFSVSFAYQVGLQSRLAPAASCTSSDLDWSLLWKCPLPPKVSIFAWQLCHNSLATGANLHRQNIQPLKGCSRCSETSETDLHIFFFCPYAQVAWKNHRLSPFKYLHKATSWLHFFQLFVADHKGSCTVLSQVIICLWGLWGARNARIFSGTQTPSVDILCRSLDFLSHFQAAMKGDSKPDRIVGLPHHWQAPSPGSLKLNIDVSYSISGVGYGFVLRDHLSTPFLSGAGPLKQITSAEHEETMAAWRILDCIQLFWD